MSCLGAGSYQQAASRVVLLGRVECRRLSATRPAVTRVVAGGSGRWPVGGVPAGAEGDPCGGEAAVDEEALGAVGLADAVRGCEGAVLGAVGAGAGDCDAALLGGDAGYLFVAEGAAEVVEGGAVADA